MSHSNGQLNAADSIGISVKSENKIAIARIPDQLDVFWVTPDGSVETVCWDHIANDTNWNTPVPIAPNRSAVGGAITSSARTHAYIDVFWIAPYGSIGSAWQDQNANDGNWNLGPTIAPPGSAVAGALTSIARTQFHIDVFWVTPNGSVSTTVWDQKTSDANWSQPIMIAPPGSAVS